MIMTSIWPAVIWSNRTHTALLETFYLYHSLSPHVRVSHVTLSPPLLHSPSPTITGSGVPRRRRRHGSMRPRRPTFLPLTSPLPRAAFLSPSLLCVSGRQLPQGRHQTLIAPGDLDPLHRPAVGVGRSGGGCAHAWGAGPAIGARGGRSGSAPGGAMRV